MRILYVSAEPLRPMQASGTHIQEIVRGLAAAGHAMTLCVSRVMGPYERTSLPRRMVAYLAFWVLTMVRLPRTDAIYARAHPVNFPIVLMARLLRKPVVQEINGSYRDVTVTHAWLKPFTGLLRASYGRQYRMASVLVAVTEGLAEMVRKDAPGVPVHTIANGVNCEIFNPSRPAARPLAKDYALFFGSLTRWHGIETIIAAISDRRWPDNLELVIVGDGQLRHRVDAATAQNSRIHAFRSLPQADLAGFIAGASLGVVPVNSVGGRASFGLSPLKLYEMLACGLPVVVTDFPGQADLVRSLEAGITIPPDDPGALAAAVASLYAMPPPRERMLAVAATIAAEHSWSARVAQLDAVLRQAVEDRRR
jgi:glycosyltransferase involved in cell wall biosynthesis